MQGNDVGRAHVENRDDAVSLQAGDEYTFMDNETYDQITLNRSQIEWELNFLKENMNVQIASYQGEMLGIQLPNSVELQVVETEPGVKGNTATNATKSAKLETGFVVQVPLFINEGDILSIDTRDGKYLSRA